MAGQAKIFKDSQVIFKQGDPADSMYIVRRGSLKIYLEKDGGEVPLAIVKEGAIVGEMAFFDDKPRSACIKAAPSVEVMEITKGEFDKILTQLPKWVVTILKSLSTRLRQTNDRVQELEKAQKIEEGGAAANMRSHQSHPFEHVVRGLKLISFAFAKDASKDGKDFVLLVSTAKEIWTDFFGQEDAATFDKVISCVTKANILALKQNSQKQSILCLSNRGAYSHFVSYFGELSKKFTRGKTFFSDEAMALFEACVAMATESGFEQFPVPLDEVIKKSEAQGTNVEGWAKACVELAVIPKLQVAKKESGGITIRVDMKEHKIVVPYIRYMKLFFDAELV